MNPDTTSRELFNRFGVRARVRTLRLADPELGVRTVETGSGTPVVLMHGITLCAAAWAPLLPRLESVRAIALDMPGHGGSSPVDFRGVDLRAWHSRMLRAVLDELGLVDMELAEEIRLLLFTFEDIVKLEDRSIQLILKEVDQKDLAIALRGVSDEVRARVFANMSERGAEMLREEIEFQPPQRRRVVEEAQGRIVGAVRRLEEAGQITISRGGGAGDDELM
jgi:hypothetical protein